MDSCLVRLLIFYRYIQSLLWVCDNGAMNFFVFLRITHSLCMSEGRIRGLSPRSKISAQTLSPLWESTKTLKKRVPSCLESAKNRLLPYLPQTLPVAYNAVSFPSLSPFAISYPLDIFVFCAPPCTKSWRVAIDTVHSTWPTLHSITITSTKLESFLEFCALTTFSAVELCTF